MAPDLPTLSDHAQNGRALAELVMEMKKGKLFAQPKPSDQLALVGFSAGGLATLLASAGNTNINCWVGLDPVGRGQQGADAAKALKIPCFVLRAEPSAWNANGNARQIFKDLPGPAFTLKVKQAVHVDAENPTTWAAELACGRSNEARRDLFGRYLLMSLRVGLLGDRAALKDLQAATNCPGVAEITFHKPELFDRLISNSPAQH